MRRAWAAAVVVAAATTVNGTPPTLALDNGLALTPPMGWSSWSDVGCPPDGVSAAVVREAAAELERTGLKKLGYTLLNVDDCWMERYRRDGRLAPVEAMGDVHALVMEMAQKGFGVGLYLDRGSKTCQDMAGSFGREELDVRQLAVDYGVSFIKVDSCHVVGGSVSDESLALRQFKRYATALRKVGKQREVVLSLCGPRAAVAGRKHGLYRNVANMWRVSTDVKTFGDVYATTRRMALVANLAGPGAWNDADHLITTSPQAWRNLTREQSRTQFSLWCVMGAPLLLASRDLTPFDVETFGNALAVRVNQDSGDGAQGGRMVVSTCVGEIPPLGRVRARDFDGLVRCFMVWGKRLSFVPPQLAAADADLDSSSGSGTRAAAAAAAAAALVMVNWDTTRAQVVGCDAKCLADVFGNDEEVVDLKGVLGVYGTTASSPKWTWDGNRRVVEATLGPSESVFLVVTATPVVPSPPK